MLAAGWGVVLSPGDYFNGSGDVYVQCYVLLLAQNEDGSTDKKV
jgi:hypothetical protein